MTGAYRFGPVTLLATFAIPELPAVVEGTRGEPGVRIDGAVALDFGGVDWYHEWRTAHDAVWLSLGRIASGYALRFPGMADFSVSADAHHIVAAQHGASDVTLRHLLLDQVLPLALSQQGLTVFHAAAIADPRGAIGLMGATGHGKSTMAASFATNGLRALTDDTLIVTTGGGQWLAHPSYPSVRVWPDSACAVVGARVAQAPRVSDYNDKVRIDAGLTFAQAPSALRALYVLAPDERCDTATIELLPPRERVMALVRHAFVLDPACVATHRARFNVLSCLASEIPVRSLRYRQSFAALRDARQLIVAA